MSLFEQVGIDGSYIVIGLAVFCLVLFVLVLMLFRKNNALKQKYEVFMQDSQGASLERLFVNKFSQVDELNQKTKEIDQKIAAIDETLLGTYQKIGIVKYDAFKEMGGKLSFAMCLLNDRNDGFIINSIHSKEGCYNYIKEIIKGESFLPLGEEEAEALEMAKQNGMAQE